MTRYRDLNDLDLGRARFGDRAILMHVFNDSNSADVSSITGSVGHDEPFHRG